MDDSMVDFPFPPTSWQYYYTTPDHLLFDSAPNLGLLISHLEINTFENCWYKSVRILEVLKLLFQQVPNEIWVLQY
jgi:hypothetical protein